MNKRPKQVNNEIIQSLIGTVVSGSFVRFSAASQLPEKVPWGGKDCHCVVLAASSFNIDSITGLPDSMVPIGTVYLVRYFRFSQENAPSRKVDDCLYYKDKEKRSWSVHSKDSPDHHSNIMSGSGLVALINDYHLPPGSSGSLEQYLSGGAHIDFTKPLNL